MPTNTEVSHLQHLVYQMALKFDEYGISDVDYEAKQMLEEAQEISEELTPESDVA